MHEGWAGAGAGAGAGADTLAMIPDRTHTFPGGAYPCAGNGNVHPSGRLQVSKAGLAAGVHPVAEASFKGAEQAASGFAHSSLDGRHVRFYGFNGLSIGYH